VILGETYPARPPGTYAAGEKPMQELSFDEAQERGYAFIGEPDYVLEKIKAQLREVGAGVFMGLFQFGSLPHALAKKNIAVFAKTVLPELHRL
jgi:alkanesulfonate monooxygenase SsuD/methylene tetrahydromethanopterin reductase-like flavin-dependent oxidoreductase (luciferase family)